MILFPVSCLLSATGTPLLARTLSWREQQFQSMHEHFVTSDPLIYIRLGIALGAILAVFLAIKLLAYLQRRRIEAAKAQPFALFVRLQAQLALPLMDRWRLWWMARTLRLPNPAAMLISPLFFDRTVEQYRPNWAHRAHLTAIRRRLFGKTGS